ncbi:diuretic hormone class 2-like [Pollicipes pollicipes]|uniref:diuretic hormone class 2-like n=1 Tax=Pollicipes pollicipes TaxID=41117 RepID=UPI00188500A2|nr:diuretic hormone class 2-like [Pollicipes pollicipes]
METAETFPLMTRHVSAISACTWLAAIVCFVFCWSFSNASMHREDAERNSWADDAEDIQIDPYVSELVSRLRTLDDAEKINLAHKRGLDFGLGRGFSATQAPSIRWAWTAAAFPGGTRPPATLRRVDAPSVNHDLSPRPCPHSCAGGSV